MEPRHAKAIVRCVQGVVSYTDPLGIAEREHLGRAAHDYDDVAARAAHVLMRGGTVKDATNLMQQVFRSGWGTAMSPWSKRRLSRRLKKDVINQFDDFC